jgi:hypothetical protein
MPTDIGIDASSGTDVLPQFTASGGAIFSRWRQVRIKDVTVIRSRDNYEDGQVNFAATQAAWELEVGDLDPTTFDTLWTFIQEHLVTPFYFYDLQNNGFVYDDEGEEESGRYLVVFDQEQFPTSYKRGSFFTAPIRIREVD